MRVRALIKFKDHKENTLRQVGDEFEVTEARYHEILEKGGAWVELVEQDNINLNGLKRAELEALALSKGFCKDDVVKARNKQELIDLIQGIEL